MRFLSNINHYIMGDIHNRINYITWFLFILFRCNTCAYILFYMDYKMNVVGDVILKKYAIPYMVLSILIVIMTELLFVLFPETEHLIYSILFINYYVETKKLLFSNSRWMDHFGFNSCVNLRLTVSIPACSCCGC